jgi:hypothetical protein
LPRAAAAVQPSATRRARAIIDQSDSGRITALLDDFDVAAWPN